MILGVKMTKSNFMSHEIDQVLSSTTLGPWYLDAVLYDCHNCRNILHLVFQHFITRRPSKSQPHLLLPVSSDLKI